MRERQQERLLLHPVLRLDILDGVVHLALADLDAGPVGGLLYELLLDEAVQYLVPYLLLRPGAPLLNPEPVYCDGRGGVKLGEGYDGVVYDGHYPVYHLGPGAGRRGKKRRQNEYE